MIEFKEWKTSMERFEKLQAAYQYLKTGNRLAARGLLLEVIEQFPGEAEAWVGLSFCAESTSERERCLERALWADPEHHYARAALARLENQEAAQSRVMPVPVAVAEGAAARRGGGWSVNQINLALAVIAAVLVGVILVAAVAMNLPAQPGQQVAVVGEGQYQFIEFYADW